MGLYTTSLATSYLTSSGRTFIVDRNLNEAWLTGHFEVPWTHLLGVALVCGEVFELGQRLGSNNEKRMHQHDVNCPA